MMKVIALLAVVLFMVSAACAEETSGATYSSPNGEINQHFIDYINSQECLDHTHSYAVEKYDPKYELGVGLDVVVYENNVEQEGLVKKVVPAAVTVQNKYDFANKNGSTYLVATYKLADLFKKAE